MRRNRDDVVLSTKGSGIFAQIPQIPQHFRQRYSGGGRRDSVLSAFQLHPAPAAVRPKRLSHRVVLLCCCCQALSPLGFLTDSVWRLLFGMRVGSGFTHLRRSTSRSAKFSATFCPVANRSYDYYSFHFFTVLRSVEKTTTTARGKNRKEQERLRCTRENERRRERQS